MISTIEGSIVEVIKGVEMESRSFWLDKAEEGRLNLMSILAQASKELHEVRTEVLELDIEQLIEDLPKILPKGAAVTCRLLSFFLMSMASGIKEKEAREVFMDKILFNIKKDAIKNLDSLERMIKREGI